ncbi:hypothetical protein [Nocardioides yefusunii]|uniref:Uncharacterized protein n=1 Tax=Nocardioides yefusunii TaxID=2500546 RepID=A0ABW1QUA3_9ACTN|nr:hypothetical protein [Nocardioides yefusunii]
MRAVEHLQPWWTFAESPSTFLGMPLETSPGWALLWGAVPALAGGPWWIWAVALGSSRTARHHRPLLLPDEPDPAMAEMLRESLTHWSDAVSVSVHRILSARGLTDAVEVDAITQSLAAATIDMLTIDSVPGAPLGNPMDAVHGLPKLLDRTLRFVPAALARRIFNSLAS